MSGHSHAKTVKRTKDANDAKRGKIFSKMARMISVAAKDGPDPETNYKLKQAIDQAKNFNMPKDNIERAIKAGSGDVGGAQLEEVCYEALGPGGISIIVECITDNKNRTLSEVKQILQKHNSKLADEGSLKWAFGQKGVINLKIKKDDRTDNQESLELAAIEAGASDIHIRDYDDEQFMEIITKPEELESTKQKLLDNGLKINSTSLDWVANEYLEIDQTARQKCEMLFEDLDDNEAIQSIYSNLKP
jgi:YebC/PmpR family DNA-binding regulatory protein